MQRQLLIDCLHAEGCSCVVANGATVRLFHQRGVKDLHHLLHNEPELLRGASLADKVVGKGAAALMAAAGVEFVYADVISRGAHKLLQRSGVEVEYGQLVENIINRSGTDICPVEKLCADCASAEECLPLIDEFIKSMSR